MKTLFTLTFLVLALLANASKINSPNSFNHSSKHSARGFEENIGQITGADANRVKFRLRNGTNTIFLLNNAIAYQFSKTEYQGQSNQLPFEIEEKMKNTSVSTYRMDMQLIGSNPKPDISKLNIQAHYNRYSSAKLDKVHFYEKVVYHNIYPKIDWVIFVNETGIKHEFVVHPGGDPNQIKFDARWVEHMSIDANGNLVLENRLGKVTENKPISLQGQKKIKSDFIIKENVISYQLANYNKNEQLIIDPQLIWGSYYGGESTEGISAVTTDSQGNVYFCGSTQSFTGIAAGGFLNNNPLVLGFFSSFLVKFTPDGDRIWATYYGGTGFTTASGCAVDSEDNVYLAGGTSDFSGISFQGFQNSPAGDFDGMLVKFNPEGERIWGTYFGGSESDDFDCITIDDNDNIYVAGATASVNLPILNAYQGIAAANTGLESDAILVKFNVQGQLLASTYFGGSASDRIFGISHNISGDIFVCGRTTSTDFPILNAHQGISGAGSASIPFDGFLAKFNAAGNLSWSTYYGGSDSDVAYSCATDNLGNVYLAGNTGSQNNIAFNGFQNSIGLGSASFLAKFNQNGVRQWGTYFGFSDNDFGSNANFGWGCATDSENNIFLVGRTRGTQNVAFQGFQNALAGGFSTDGYIAKFSTSGTRLWASYYGGDFDDGLRGCHIDPSNQLYVVGQTNSSNNIFFQGFQSSFQNGTGYIAKIGCPSPSIANLPQELCANSSIQINPLPAGGTLQLIGSGTLVSNIYAAPNVSAQTIVAFTYSINASGQCPVGNDTFNLIIQPNISPMLVVESSQTTICEGEEITFNAELNNAGANPTINWLVNNIINAQNVLSFTSSSLSNNDQIQCEIQTTVSCADPSTLSSNSIVVTVNPNPALDVFFSDINGGTLVATPGFSSYQWFLNGEPLLDGNATFLKPKENGIYTLVVTNEFGCTTSVESTVQSVSIAELDVSSVKVYPNPATEGWCVIETDNYTSKKIRLMNVLGAIVFETINADPMTFLKTDALPNGVYLLTIDFDGDQKTQTLLIKSN